MTEMEKKLNCEVEDIPEHSEVKLVKFSGEVDLSNSHEIVDTIFALIDRGDIYIIVDLKELKYINSAGIFNLLRCDDKLKEIGGWIRIINVQRSILDVLNSLGITKIFAVCNDLEEALQKK